MTMLLSSRRTRRQVPGTAETACTGSGSDDTGPTSNSVPVLPAAQLDVRRLVEDKMSQLYRSCEAVARQM